MLTAFFILLGIFAIIIVVAFYYAPEMPDKGHYDTIECPECKHQQKAYVEYTEAWPIFIKRCEQCDYTIMESEWNKIDEGKPRLKRATPKENETLCDDCDGFGLFSPELGHYISKDEECVICRGTGIK